MYIYIFYIFRIEKNIISICYTNFALQLFQPVNTYIYKRIFLYCLSRNCVKTYFPFEFTKFYDVHFKLYIVAIFNILFYIYRTMLRVYMTKKYKTES